MLSKTAQKRLDRISEIQQDIRELYGELEGILGAGEDGLVTGALTAGAVMDTIKKSKSSILIPRKWGDACKECGSTRRHFKTCSQSPQPKNVVKPSVALTVDQYDELRDAMHDKEFQSVRFAMSHKMSPKEVNMAVQTGSYADYLNKREALEKA